MEFKDPTLSVNQEKKILKDIIIEEGLNLLVPVKNESNDENMDHTKMANVIFAAHVKSMQETKKTHKQNLVKLWGVIHG